MNARGRHDFQVTLADGRTVYVEVVELHEPTSVMRTRASPSNDDAIADETKLARQEHARHTRE